MKDMSNEAAPYNYAHGLDDVPDLGIQGVLRPDNDHDGDAQDGTPGLADTHVHAESE